MSLKPISIAVMGTAAGTSMVGSLSIAGDATPTAKLDLANNAAIINYTGASPVATVHQQILTGRGGSGLGATWDGQGITSYNGFVDDDDVTLSGAFYDPSAAPLVVAFPSSAGVAAVPEPSTFVLLAAVTAVLLLSHGFRRASDI